MTKNDISVNWDKVRLNVKGKETEYPLFRVKIWGSPKLSELFSLMNKINKATDGVEKEYISITDFTNLDASKLLEALIPISMSKSLKTLIGVHNQARLSIVVLGNQPNMKKLRKRLIQMNEKTDESDYQYNYVFIKTENLLKKKAEELLDKYPSEKNE